MSLSTITYRKFQLMAIAASLCMMCGSVTAQTAKSGPAAKPPVKGDAMPPTKAPAAHPIVTADSLKWSPFFPGVQAIQMAVVSGNPSATGPFVVRLKISAGAEIAAHWHPTTENVTVLQGTLSVGMGDKLDPAKLTKMQPGDFVSVPARMHHFARAETDAIVQVHAPGPFVITFINPADDPRIKK